MHRIFTCSARVRHELPHMSFTFIDTGVLMPFQRLLIAKTYRTLRRVGEPPHSARGAITMMLDANPGRATRYTDGTVSITYYLPSQITDRPLDSKDF